MVSSLNLNFETSALEFSSFIKSSRWRKINTLLIKFNFQSTSDEQIEVRHDDIRDYEELGMGVCGTVYRCIYKGKLQMAVKVLR